MAENKPSKRAQYIKSEQVETKDLIDKAKTILGIEKEKLASQQKSLDIERELNKLRQEYGDYSLKLEQAFEDKISSTVDHIDYLSVKLKQMKEDNKENTDEYEEQRKQLNNSINLYTRLAEEQEKNSKGISDSTREHAKYLEQLKEEHTAAVGNLNRKKEELRIAEEELENAKKSKSIGDAELKAAKEKVKAKKEEVAAAKGDVSSKEGKYKKAIADDGGTDGNWADALSGAGTGGKLLGTLFGKNKETPLYEAFMNKGQDKAAGFLSENINLGEELGGQIAGAMGPAVKALEVAAKAMDLVSNALDSFVNRAAKVFGNLQGTTNAYLYGYSNLNYFTDSIMSSIKKADLAGSTLLTQEEYLEAVKSIASQGIAEGLETAALLTSIAEKTVPQFNATSDAVRRLVLLQEKSATQRFFGLESILQQALNGQFGETSYLNKLFDSVNSNLMDAMVQLGNKIGNDSQYSFLSTVQHWLSYLYEQGVDQSTVSKISNTLNALGSGNISQVASDSGMQKLLLLSMDKANMDYATILQNGLSATAVDTLMSSMVNYLKDIVKSTGSNNVLESAYANMFGLSMTDMAALRNLQTPNVPNINQTTLESNTSNRLGIMGDSAFTTIAERIDNLSSNLQFGFGSRIVDNSIQYSAWKGTMLAKKIGDSLGGISGKIISGVANIGLLAQAVVPGLGLIGDVTGAAWKAMHGENTVQSLYQEVTNKTIKNRTNFLDAVNEYSGTDLEKQAKKDEEKFKELQTEYETSEYGQQVKEAEKAEEQDDEATRILKEVEKTLMKNKEGNLAIAVSLQAMSDEVLRSFASIFADEDSMEEIFKNKKTKNKLFDYEGDETDSGKSSKNKNKNSTTGEKKS